MTYIDRKHVDDWNVHAERKVDDRPTTDERHLVIIYGDDSVETAQRLEQQARAHGWTILYRESVQ